ncbi:MAG: hypothetical protein Q7U30_02280, partial [Methylicorpusculum sp.]|nr:hypothetical protein [Methylicorpusculum sp.]
MKFATGKLLKPASLRIKSLAGLMTSKHIKIRKWDLSFPSSNSQFDLFGVILGWEKPFEERRKPFHGGLTAASLLPTSSKSFPPPFFPFKLRIAASLPDISSFTWKRYGAPDRFW